MEFKGASLLRYRVIASLLSGKKLKISEIRSKSDYPGLNNAEVKYLQLIGRITAGSVIDINESGTIFEFTPGVIVNNPGHGSIVFDCGNERSIGFYLEGILPLVVFGKNKLNLTLRGSSHLETDNGVDSVVYAQLPILKKFGVEGVNIKVMSRGDSCEVVLTVSPVRKLTNLHLTDPGKVKKVRGLAFTSKMNVQLGNRAAYAAKGNLHSFLPDIWIHTDHYKQGEARLGITLVAETTTDCFITSEFLASEKSHIEHLENDVPEDLGTLAVLHLLDEIMYGGCVDSNNQALVLLFMALAGGQSEIRLGRVSVSAIEVMRLIDHVFNVRFNFQDAENPVYQESQDDDQEENEEDIPMDLPKNTILSCIGIDFENMARIAF